MGGPAVSEDSGLADVLDQAWALLAQGAGDRHSPWRTLNLATIAADGRPNVRTVVLRATARRPGTVRVHTDRRSEKARELAGDPRVMLHGYDPAGAVQLRLAGRARLHIGDAVAAAGWAASAAMSRACYRGAAPGSIVPAPPPAPDARGEGGADNFAVVEVTIETLEWLWLCAAGHRRARFDLAAGTGHWLAP